VEHKKHGTKTNLSAFVTKCCRDVEQGRGWTSAGGNSSSSTSSLQGGWIWDERLGWVWMPGSDRSGWVDWGR